MALPNPPRSAVGIVLPPPPPTTRPTAVTSLGNTDHNGLFHEMDVFSLENTLEQATGIRRHYLFIQRVYPFAVQFTVKRQPGKTFVLLRLPDRPYTAYRWLSRHKPSKPKTPAAHTLNHNTPWKTRDFLVAVLPAQYPPASRTARRLAETLNESLNESLNWKPQVVNNPDILGAAIDSVHWYGAKVLVYLFNLPTHKYRTAKTAQTWKALSGLLHYGYLGGHRVLLEEPGRVDVECYDDVKGVWWRVAAGTGAAVGAEGKCESAPFEHLAGFDIAGDEFPQVMLSEHMVPLCHRHCEAKGRLEEFYEHLFVQWGDRYAGLVDPERVRERSGLFRLLLAARRGGAHKFCRMLLERYRDEFQTFLTSCSL